MRSYIKLACSLLLVLWSSVSMAQITLPSLMSDNMVLQQNVPAHIWGWSAPLERVEVSLAHHTVSTYSDRKGHWSVKLPPLRLDGTHVMTIRSLKLQKVTDKVEIRNILVGTVWVASGQSNMEWPVKKASGAKSAMTQANFPEIRFFKVAKSTALSPQKDVRGRWVVISPDTVGDLSAVAYAFGKQLYSQLKQYRVSQTGQLLMKPVPIGIIQSAWGSTKIEAWTALNALQTIPTIKPVLKEVERQLKLPDDVKVKQSKKRLAWEKDNFLQDPGNKGYKLGFAAPDYNDSTWKVVNLPGVFSQFGFNDDGAVWFRKTFTVDHKINTPLHINLGTIDDFDVVYVNGVKVGSTAGDIPHYWLSMRDYVVPEGVIKKGENTIAIRVFDHYGDGGLTGHVDDLYLATEAGKQKIGLAGQWRYQVEYKAQAKKADFSTMPQLPYGLANRNTPSVLYNAMVAPLTSYTIEGVIWYQGESNAAQASLYQQLFSVMIQQWRRDWQKDLPFLFVQLANYEASKQANGVQTWAKLRAAQSRVFHTMDKVGMVTAVDVGDANDIHPKNKRIVGQRLARWALARVYGFNINYRGPEYRSHRIKRLYSGKKDSRVRWRIVLNLDHASGLYSNTKDLVGFEVSDDGENYVKVAAFINEGSIFLYSHLKNEPKFLRYGWRNDPVISLYNAENFPLKPFDIDFK